MVKKMKPDPSTVVESEKPDPDKALSRSEETSQLNQEIAEEGTAANDQNVKEESEPDRKKPRFDVDDDDEEEKDEADDGKGYDDDELDYQQYMKDETKWIANARAAVEKISKTSGAVTLSLFYNFELEGSMPDVTANQTMGVVEEDIAKAVVVAKGDDKNTTKIEYSRFGTEGGGLPGSDFGDVETVKEACEWLLRRAPDDEDGQEERPKLYLRLWPWDIHEGDHWVEYACGDKDDRFNDLNRVGLLEGSWYDDDKSKDEARRLERILKQALQDF